MRITAALKSDTEAAVDRPAAVFSVQKAEAPVRSAADAAAQPAEPVAGATAMAQPETELDSFERHAAQGEERRADTKLRVPELHSQRAFESVVRADAVVAEMVDGDALRPGRVAPEAPRVFSREHLDPAALLGQIGAGARRALELSRVSVQLSPPDLGTIQIAVQSRQGQLSAHFHASHPAVGAWLESHVGALRAELAEAGVSLRDFSFSGESWQRGGQWLHEPGSGSNLEPRPPGTAHPTSNGADSRTDQIATTVDWRA